MVCEVGPAVVSGEVGLNAITPREAARTRKQRQRDRQREAARVAAEAQAARTEADNERLSPAVMRDAVTYQDGRVLIGPRVMITNGRAARADPIAGCKSFTADQKQAARKIQLDWNDVGAGIGVGAVDYLRSGGGGSGDGGHAAILEQCQARGRLEGAMAFCGAFAPSVARVVLDGVPISSWVLEPGDWPKRRHDDGTPWTYAEGVAWIGLALTRLASFYLPPVEARGVRVHGAIGPGRAAYSVELAAA